jgi:hypothetical protein
MAKLKKNIRVSFACDKCGLETTMNQRYLSSRRRMGAECLCTACRNQEFKKNAFSNSWCAKRATQAAFETTILDTPLGDCTIRATRSGRCRYLLKCSDYYRCMTTAAKKGWEGFDRVE